MDILEQNVPKDEVRTEFWHPQSWSSMLQEVLAGTCWFLMLLWLCLCCTYVEGRVKAVWVRTFTEQPLGKTYNNNHKSAGIKSSW